MGRRLTLTARAIRAMQSSRRLEREAGRNVEVMWLLGRLAPDHKTIADFRKDNGLALRKVCARFVELCREMGLLATASVAIDGSKFKAVNNRDKNFTRAKVQRRRAQLEESVARYLSQLDTADRQESRSMATSGRGSGVVGYNVQVAVDTEHHLTIDLSKITVPVYLLASREDHIVPWKSAFRSKDLIGGDARFVLAASGHVAGIQAVPFPRRRSWVIHNITR